VVARLSVVALLVDTEWEVVSADPLLEVTPKPQHRVQFSADILILFLILTYNVDDFVVIIQSVT
jgi:hypothetical protein